jgi:hypothetical protein
VRQILELIDVDRSLSLRLLIVEHRPKPAAAPKKEHKPATTFEEILCRAEAENKKLEKVKYTLPELWEASQRARQLKKDRRKAGHVVPKIFGAVSVIDIPKHVSMALRKFSL